MNSKVSRIQIYFEMNILKPSENTLLILQVFILAKVDPSKSQDNTLWPLDSSCQRSESPFIPSTLRDFHIINKAKGRTPFLHAVACLASRFQTQVFVSIHNAFITVHHLAISSSNPIIQTRTFKFNCHKSFSVRCSVAIQFEFWKKN